MSLTTTIEGGQVQLTGNPVWIKVSGGFVPIGATGYKYLLRILSPDGKLYGAPFIDAIAPNENGDAWFDISGLVNQPVKPVFQYPPVGTHVAYPTQAFNIQVQNGETYFDSSGDLQENWGTTSAVFQMLKGGLSQRKVATLRDAGGNFYTEYIQGGRFLTARGWGDQVHTTQAVKLWFMTGANRTVDFKIRLVYTDYTEVTQVNSGIDLDTDFLYEFNCNPAHYGIDLEPAGKKAFFFDVWIESAGVVKSKVFRFHYDMVYCERPIFLMFANAYGGIDDVYFNGFIKDKFVTTGDVVNRPALRMDTVLEPTIQSVGKMGQNKWTLNTGYHPLTTLQFYRELLVCSQAWYLYYNITMTEVIVYPIIIENISKTIIDRKSNLHSLDIEVSEAHTTQHSFFL